MTRRQLSHMEQAIADNVFQGTIPYSGVRITDAIGLGNRPYTLYQGGMNITGVLESDDVYRSKWRKTSGDRDEDHWNINVGKQLFPGLEKTAVSQALLIHELTHVWQSAHSVWPAAYIFNSAWHQLKEGDDAYIYSPGLDWHAYNVEQQAHIVEDWFARGMQSGEANFRYVRDNIRVAKKFK